MAAKEQSQDGAGTIVVVLVLVMVMVAMWSLFYRPYFARAVTALAVAETRVLLTFHRMLPAWYNKQLVDIYKGGRRLLARPGVKQFERLTTAKVFEIWNVPSKALLPMMLLLMGVGGWHVHSTNVAERFRRRYSLNDLIKLQAEFYPHLRPLVHEKIDETPMREGDWRIPLSHIEFAIQHKLLFDAAGRPITTKGYELRAAGIDVAAARAAFLKQMGRRWTDKLEDYLPHERAMFGLLAAMVSRDRPTAMKVAAQLSTSWRRITPRNKPHYYSVESSEGEAAARKYWNNPEVRKARLSHAYFYGVMAALAARKRNAGELACSHYIWLRPTDRRLFFVLHQEGLPQPHWESAAPYAHFETERRSGVAIPEPQVDKAVSAIRIALVDEGWLTAGAQPAGPGGGRPTGQEWTESASKTYSRGARRAVQ